MKQLGLIVLVFLALADFGWLESAYAKKMDNRFGYAFGALGRIYNYGTLRVGHDNFEIGFINTTSIGVMGLARAGNTPFYGGFGFGILWNTLGFYTEAGMEYKILSFLDLRLAVTPAVNVQGLFRVGTFIGFDVIL